MHETLNAAMKPGQRILEGFMTKAKSTANNVPLPAMPVFYGRPRPLNSTVDRGKSLGPLADFGFARATNSVVVSAVEFPHVVRTYPIVFTTAEPRAAIAILGLEAKENLFVTETGTWQPNTYIPAYVRRYPFILMEQPEKNEYVLCIDEDAGLLSESDERPLFKDDAPTQVIQDALNFCREFQEQTAITSAFVSALVEHDLLIQNEARVALNSGKQMTLRDFNVIDEAKFNALPDEVFLDWRRRGWLHLVYFHLLSMGNWSNLVELAAKKA
jgi:SapC